MMRNLERRLVAATVGLTAALLGFATDARADGVETHDGLYLRLHLGFGYNDMAADSSPEVTVTGTGGAFGFSIGGMVMENFGIFAELSDAVTTSPEMKAGGKKASPSDVAVGVVGMGGGAIYYFMPLNLYVSLALLGDRLSIIADDEKVAETDMGLGVNLMVGKEWWVSDNWGLGVAAALRHSRMDDKGGKPTWSITSANVAFSATFN